MLSPGRVKTKSNSFRLAYWKHMHGGRPVYNMIAPCHFDYINCHSVMPFVHKFTHRRRSQHLETQLGRAGDRTSNLPVTSQPALPSDYMFCGLQ